MKEGLRNNSRPALPPVFFQDVYLLVSIIIKFAGDNSTKEKTRMKSFKTTGKCLPDRHYMVNIDRQVDAAVSLIDRGEYFCINRGRQFGKTTTLAAMKSVLEKKGYTVFSLSFESIGDSPFASLETLLYTSLNLMQACVDFNEVENLSEEAAEALKPYLRT